MGKQAEGLLIDPEEVNAVFVDCFYKTEELEGVKGFPDGAVIVDGIQGKFGFHPGRLKEYEPKVKAWLKALPHQFRQNGGGGWSFLNACNQDNGVQWTGFQQRMDQLFCLAMGLGLAKHQFPREMWPVLPGGVPYYVIFVE